MAVVLYRVKVRKGQKRSQGSKKVKPKVRVNALPFMPFYDVLCPLVPENEKGQKGSQGAQGLETTRQRQRTTFYDLLCPFTFLPFSAPFLPFNPFCPFITFFCPFCPFIFQHAKKWYKNLLLLKFFVLLPQLEKSELKNA